MEQTKRILILNGPPGCGKDALASFLVKNVNDSKHLMFKESLYKLALDAAGLQSHYTELFTDRQLKESIATSPFYVAGQKVSPRQWLIHTSENLIKPNFGKSFFGDKAASVIAASNAKLFVFSDGGFKEEVLPLIDVGHVTIIQIKRPNCSYKGDSRNWLTPEMFPHGSVDMITLDNSRDLGYFLRQGMSLIQDFK